MKHKELYFDYISPPCDLDTEDSTICSEWHFGPWCFITTPSLVQNILWFKRQHPDKHSLTFWTFGVTLILNAVIQFFHRTLQFMMLYYQTKSDCKQTSSLEHIAKSHILITVLLLGFYKKGPKGPPEWKNCRHRIYNDDRQYCLLQCLP